MALEPVQLCMGAQLVLLQFGFLGDCKTVACMRKTGSFSSMPPACCTHGCQSCARCCENAAGAELADLQTAEPGAQPRLVAHLLA